MRKSFLLFSILIVSVLSHADEKIVSIDTFAEFEALEYDEKWRLYLPDAESPFTGKLLTRDFGPGAVSGSVTESNFHEGRTEGYQVIWRSEAREIPQYEWYAKNGFRDGLFISYGYHPTGAGYEPMRNLIVDGVKHFKNGYLHGYTIDYFGDGSLRARFHYVDGVKDGKCSLWNENHELVYSGNYYKGFRDGEWSIQQDDNSYKAKLYDGKATFQIFIELAGISEQEYFLAQQLKAKYGISFERMPEGMREKAFYWWDAITNAKKQIRKSMNNAVID